MTAQAVPPYPYNTGFYFEPSSSFDLQFQTDDTWAHDMASAGQNPRRMTAHSSAASTVPSLSASHSIHSVASSQFNSPELCPPPNQASWNHGGLDAVSNLLALNTSYEEPAFGMEPPYFEKTLGFVGKFCILSTALAVRVADFSQDPSVLQPPLLLTPVSTTPVSAICNSSNRQRSFSPAASFASLHSTNQALLRSTTQSPYPRTPFTESPVWQTKPSQLSRRDSVASIGSVTSPANSGEVETATRGQTRCPYPDCRKVFKDLKAHLLTHQNERPEKCPITSCEFHKKGFARKYDRNRHLVTTHYKSTIVCGFCPGSGSSAEKSFNRTDVFKRHLIAVHAVEAVSANNKKRSSSAVDGSSQASGPGINGKCSTCSRCFSNAQQLFEHLDDCVLKVVTQTDPAEETNEQHLRSMEDDEDFQATMDRNVLGEMQGMSSPVSEDDWFDDVAGNSGLSGPGSIQYAGHANRNPIHHTTLDGHISKNTANGAVPRGRPGMTFSKNGKPLPVGKGRKKRKGDYPQSWGCPQEKMTMKKRVLCVFDGQRRLWKDDMMLGADQEVRMPIGNDGAYVTDLDVETLRRAEGFHGATEEQRGPWIPSNYRGWDQETVLF